MTQEPDFPKGYSVSPWKCPTHFLRDINKSVKTYEDIPALTPNV